MFSPALLFGIGLATIDGLSFGIVKNVHLQQLPYWTVLVSVALYALTPLIMLAALRFTSLTVMNLTWDLSSDILVTLMGLLWFKEILSDREIIGMLLAITSIILFSTS